MEGKTKSGFTFKVDERATKTWRFISLTKEMTKGTDFQKFEALDEALDILLGGPEEKERLLQHVESQNEGYAVIEKVIDEFNEIVDSMEKNSSSSPTA